MNRHRPPHPDNLYYYFDDKDLATCRYVEADPLSATSWGSPRSFGSSSCGTVRMITFRQTGRPRQMQLPLGDADANR